MDLNVVGTAFSLRMGLNSWIADMGFGRGGTVLMWGTGATGTHGGGEYTEAAGTHGAEYILGLVARHADDFVAPVPACQRRALHSTIGHAHGPCRGLLQGPAVECLRASG